MNHVSRNVRILENYIALNNVLKHGFYEDD